MKFVRISAKNRFTIKILIIKRCFYIIIFVRFCSALNEPAPYSISLFSYGNVVFHSRIYALIWEDFEVTLDAKVPEEYDVAGS